MTHRLSVIFRVLKDLAELEKKSVSADTNYAIKENQIFFEAIKTIPGYIYWLIFHMPSLQKEKLLELTDFSLQHWDEEMHKKLIEIERKKIPGLIDPLVRRLFQYIIQHKHTKSPIFIADFGSGAMEVERQVITRLIQAKSTIPIIFIGIDNSSTVAQIAKKNLISVDNTIEIHERVTIDATTLQTICENTKHKYCVVLCTNNIFNKFFLKNSFPNNFFDLVFSSFVKHHLDASQKKELVNTALSLGKTVLEYDGYRSLLTMIPQTLVGWNNPVFFNAEIFSNLRFLHKRDIKRIQDPWKISFHRAAHYLAEYTK